MIMPEKGDPFVLMDLAKYQELLTKRQPAKRTSDKDQMEQDLALWEQTKRDLAVEDRAQEGTQADQEQEKYYFEPIEAEGSQSEATK